MMEDIASKLLENIKKTFAEELSANSKINSIYEKINAGTATYEQANEFAIEVGELLARAYKSHISSDVLPDGKMYYEIAEQILNATLGNNYNLITDVTKQVQQSLNQLANVGIKAIVPELNQDRIDGLVNKVSSYDSYDDAAWVLAEPVKTFSQSIVDDSIKANAEFHSKCGMQPKIVRKIAGNCCEWCRNLAGSYTYPDDVPDDVYRRHQRCRCTVDYKTSDGKVQNVHTKQWKNQEERGKIKKRKQIAKVDSSQDTGKTEYRKHVGENGLSYAESRAITNYISSDSYVINDKLRRKEILTNLEQKFCEDLDSALEKIPTYAGDLSRSLYFYSQEEIDEFLKEVKKQRIITFKEYISTTKDTELYNPDGQVQLYIRNATKGHDLSNFNKSELEVLYERESKFKVESIMMYEKMWHILLKEA